MEREIRKITPLSLANIQGIMGLIIGFLYGLAALLITLSTGQAMIPGLMTWAILPVTIIAYGVGSFIIGLLTAWIYNLVAAWIGGIVLELR